MRLGYYKKLLKNFTLEQPKAEWFSITRAKFVDYIKLQPVLSENRVLGKAVAGQSRYWVFKPALSVAGILLVLFGATGVAAQQSLPNDFLYPVKIATEKLRLALTPSTEGKIEAYLAFADRRIREVEQLVKRHEPDSVVTSTLNSYEGEVQNVTAVLPSVVQSDKNEQLLQRVRENLSKHQEVLLQVASVPEPVVSNLNTEEKKNIEDRPMWHDVTKALKVSSEGELKILDKSFGKVDNISEGEILFKTNSINLKSEADFMIPADKAESLPKVEEAKPEAVVVNNIDRSEVEKKINLAQTEILKLEGYVTDENNEGAIVDKLAFAKEFLQKAQNELAETNKEHSNNYSKSYQYALVAYQSVLGVEINLGLSGEVLIKSGTIAPLPARVPVSDIQSSDKAENGH